jgi:hypothetical protein
MAARMAMRDLMILCSPDVSLEDLVGLAGGANTIVGQPLGGTNPVPVERLG